MSNYYLYHLKNIVTKRRISFEKAYDKLLFDRKITARLFTVPKPTSDCVSKTPKGLLQKFERNPRYCNGLCYIWTRVCHVILLQRYQTFDFVLYDVPILCHKCFVT